MKHRLFVFVVFTLSLTLTSMIGVHPVAAACLLASDTLNTGGLSPLIAIKGGHSITITLTDNTSAVGNLIIEDVFGFHKGKGSVSSTGTKPHNIAFMIIFEGPLGHTLSWSVVDNSCGSSTGSGSVLPFMDGRCNQEDDQTVAVYPDGKGGYDFYAVFQGVGYFAFRVTEQNLDDNPVKSTNYLIAHNLNVWLYRLTDGSLLVTGIKPDGKQYSYNIGSCGAMED